MNKEVPVRVSHFPLCSGACHRPPVRGSKLSFRDNSCPFGYTQTVFMAYDRGSMSAPRFRPRWYTPDPKLFGKAPVIRWNDAVTDQQATQVVASRIQHDYASAIRAAADQQHGNLKAYAEATDADYQRLTRVLRGDAIMRLEDIADAHRHLGVALPHARKADE